MKTKYTAYLYGNSWAIGPKAGFNTITEARKWAESYGITADKCYIQDVKDRTVAIHIRSMEGCGRNWFKGCKN
jgi:hypothetical protein